jgi:two-component system cell cycle sensor histidine kinase PleC
MSNLRAREITTDSAWTAGHLAVDLPPIDYNTTCGEVFHFFSRAQAQVAAAVVDEENRVVGLVNRLRFLARYAQQYIPELYAKRPIAALANTHPLVVDENLPLIELASQLTLEWPDALRECFIITREGKYSGIGTSEAIVRAKLAVLHAQEEALTKALATAHSANQAKGHFLALMSHELRTPLNAIIGFSEVLSAELFGEHANARYKEYSEDIHRAGRHLLELINDILDLSKTEAGKLDLHVEPVDLKDLFAETEKLVADRAARQGVRLTTTIATDFPPIACDRLRMKQVLLNLLGNSVKFTPSGGTIELAACLALDGGAIVSVTDTGIGMDPKSIPVALEPFRQIDSPLSRKVEGTGLGLALVKSMVELHGGQVRIESALNVGTRVDVVLPPGRTVWQAGADEQRQFGT